MKTLFFAYFSLALLMGAPSAAREPEPAQCQDRDRDGFCIAWTQGENLRVCRFRDVRGACVWALQGVEEPVCRRNRDGRCVFWIWLEGTSAAKREIPVQERKSSGLGDCDEDYSAYCWRVGCLLDGGDPDFCDKYM